VEAAGCQSQETQSEDGRPAETASFYPADATKRMTLQTDYQTHQRLLSTCAQMAIIPKNSDSEARAAASSTTARNMTASHSKKEHKENLVRLLFFVKRPGPRCFTVAG
jgi:hypothetical protein